MCAEKIIVKYDLNKEVEEIWLALQNQTFIDILQNGNYTQVKGNIKRVTRSLIDRLGQNTDFIFFSMPDAVLEWMRMTALVMTVDIEKIVIKSLNGTDLGNEGVNFNKVLHLSSGKQVNETLYNQTVKELDDSKAEN